MRRVILNIAVSLDGYIEGPNGEIDWCLTDQDYGMKAFMKRVDAIFFGRKSYELVVNVEKNPYPKTSKYVFSRRLKKVTGNTQIVRGDIKKEVMRIKKLKGKDIWLFGGSNLVTGFANAGLIDELHLAIHPLFLGGGKPLFQRIKLTTHYKLKSMKNHSTGLLQLLYEKKQR